jgi:uncharacterized protein (TIGR02246 family)
MNDHMKIQWLAITGIFIYAMIFTSVKAEEPHCVKVSESGVASLFDRWNTSLATLDPDKVLENYGPNAVLLPTLSNRPRTNPEEIRDYFVHFLENKPQGKIDFRVIKLGCNIASDTGLYTFVLHGKKGKVKHTSARYSFVYEYINGKWYIDHHHSSLMPEKIHSKR